MTIQQNEKPTSEGKSVDNVRPEHIEPQYLSEQDLFVLSGPFFQARIVTRQGLVDMGFEGRLTSGTN